MTHLASVLLVLLALSACSRRPTPAPSPSASAATSVAAPPAARTVVRHGIEWYEDTAAAAIDRARRERKPLLVDLWAPWCHTCLSMQAFVLTDAALPGLRERFVFLALDTERSENAAFLERFAVSVWPTFYVMDPDGPEVRGRWLGAASPAEFARFANEGAEAVELGRAFPPEDPRASLLEADRLAAEKRFLPAATKYAEALARAPSDWPRKPGVLVAQITQYSKARDYGACADLALARIEETGEGVSAADFASHTLNCAGKLPNADPRIEPLRRRAARRLTGLCEGSAGELTADDRGDACANLEAVRRELGDIDGSRRAAERGLAVVRAASEGLPDEVAHTYDRATSDFLVTLGRADEALELLRKREAALPDNYNPPHLQARVYRKLDRFTDALAAIDRSLSRAYGPRRANLMSLKVDLLLAMDRKPAARATLTDQLAAYQALPPGQKQPEAEETARKRLTALE